MTSTVAGKAVGVARSGQRAALALSISVPEVVDDDNGIRANAIARLFAFPPAGNDWGIALIRRQSLTFNPPYQTLAPLLYAAPFPIPESLRRPIYGIGDGSWRRRCCARSGRADDAASRTDPSLGKLCQSR